jgi:hypothetical protein
MGEKYEKYGGEERCIQGFGWETCLEELCVVGRIILK